jgi:hypothetical protein
MSNWFSTSSTGSKCIFVVIVLYLIATVILLATAGGSTVSDNPYILIGFSLASFTLTVVVSAFHLSTLIRRRKRKSDKIADGTWKEKKA